MPFTTLDLSKQSGTSLPSSITSASGLSTGKIGQVINVANGSASNTTSTSWSDQSNATVNITPSATSSKILVTYSIGGWYVANTTNMGHIKLVQVIGGSATDVVTPAHESSYI